MVKSAPDLVPALPLSAARARLLQMLSARFLMEGRFDQAAQVGVEAIAAARAVGEVEAEFRAHNILAPSLVHIGRVDEGLATFETARGLAGDVRGGWSVTTSTPPTPSTCSGGTPRPRRSPARASTGRREMGRAQPRAMLAGNTAEPLLALGEWDEAERLITRALELDPPVRHVWHLPTPASMVVDVAR